MVNQIYPTELQLNKANSFDTEAPILDLDLSIMNGNDIVSSKNDKQDTFFKILKQLISHFLMEIFLIPLRMVCTFRNLFVMREYVLMLVTSTIKLWMKGKIRN